MNLADFKKEILSMTRQKYRIPSKEYFEQFCKIKFPNYFVDFMEDFEPFYCIYIGDIRFTRIEDILFNNAFLDYESDTYKMGFIFFAYSIDGGGFFFNMNEINSNNENDIYYIPPVENREFNFYDDNRIVKISNSFLEFLNLQIKKEREYIDSYKDKTDEVFQYTITLPAGSVFGCSKEISKIMNIDINISEIEQAADYMNNYGELRKSLCLFKDKYNKDRFIFVDCRIRDHLPSFCITVRCVKNEQEKIKQFMIEYCNDVVVDSEVYAINDIQNEFMNKNSSYFWLTEIKNIAL